MRISQKNIETMQENPDILYQDIAQADQVNIFVRNYKYFKPKYGFFDD